MLAVIAVLAAAVLPSFQKHLESGRVGAATKTGLCLQSAFTSYAAKYPEQPRPAADGRVGLLRPPERLLPARRREPGAAAVHWVTLHRSWCSVMIGNKPYKILCPLNIPGPNTPPSMNREKVAADPDALQATSAELTLTVSGVSPETRGYGLLISPDRGVLQLTQAELQRVETDMQPAPGV